MVILGAEFPCLQKLQAVLLTAEEEQPKDTIEQVILRRGSTRAFDKTASIPGN
jgi:hypothetical protein